MLASTDLVMPWAPGSCKRTHAHTDSEKSAGRTATCSSSSSSSPPTPCLLLDSLPAAPSSNPPMQMAEALHRGDVAWLRQAVREMVRAAAAGGGMPGGRDPGPDVAGLDPMDPEYQVGPGGFPRLLGARCWAPWAGNRGHSCRPIGCSRAGRRC